jgi:hypothetical protein
LSFIEKLFKKFLECFLSRFLAFFAVKEGQKTPKIGQIDGF